MTEFQPFFSTKPIEDDPFEKFPPSLLSKMTTIALRNLQEIEHPSPLNRGKDTVKRLLKRPGDASIQDPLFWPAGLLLLGLVETGNPEAQNSARTYLQRHLHAGGAHPRLLHVDDALAMGAGLRLYQKEEERIGALEQQSPQEASRRSAIPSRFRDFSSRREDFFSRREDFSSRREDFSSRREDFSSRRKDFSSRRKDFSSLLHEGERFADILRKLPADAEGSLIYNPASGGDDIFADGCGMVSFFFSLLAACKGQDRSSYLSFAASQLTAFLQHGMDKRSGLPYHGYSLKKGAKQGIPGWSRAAGWLLMGYTEYLIACKKKNGRQSLPDEKLFLPYFQLLSNLLNCQREDGALSWILCSSEGAVDTSGLSMLCYAIGRAEGEGLLAECPTLLPQQIFSLRNSLLPYIREDGLVTGSLSACEDFAVHRQIYGSYPWGQGAALAAISLSLTAKQDPPHA